MLRGVLPVERWKGVLVFLTDSIKQVSGELFLKIEKQTLEMFQADILGDAC
jgi:hypothetical protein